MTAFPQRGHHVDVVVVIEHAAQRREWRSGIPDVVSQAAWSPCVLTTVGA
jgi:hypothetical protein